MVMTHVVEEGFAHRVILVKGLGFVGYCLLDGYYPGLELTETSCHTTEATHLEEVLDWSFSPQNASFGTIYKVIELNPALHNVSCLSIRGTLLELLSPEQ